MCFVTKLPHVRILFWNWNPPRFPCAFSPRQHCKNFLESLNQKQRAKRSPKTTQHSCPLCATPCARPNDTLVFLAEPIQPMRTGSSVCAFLRDQKDRLRTVGPTSIRWSDRWCFSLPQALRQKGSHTTSSSPSPDTHGEGQPDRGRPLIDRLATTVQYRAGVQDVCHTQA